MFSSEDQKIEEAYRKMCCEAADKGFWSKFIDFWNGKPAWTEEPNGFNYSNGELGHGREISDQEAAGYTKGTEMALATSLDVATTINPAIKAGLAAKAVIPGVKAAGLSLAKNYAIWDIAAPKVTEKIVEKIVAGKEKFDNEFEKLPDSEKSKVETEIAKTTDSVIKNTSSSEELSNKIQNLGNSLSSGSVANSALVGLGAAIVAFSAYVMFSNIMSSKKKAKKPAYLKK